MPKILENEALALVENIDSLAPEQQVQAADILRRYRQQQIDLGEPEWPSYEQAEQESEGRFRALFDDLQNVDKQSPSFVQSLKFRTDPDAGRARVAGTAFLSRVYQKQPEEVSRMFPLLRDDYLNKRGQKTGLDDRAFYSFAQGEVKRMTARESAAIEGKKAALRGEDSGKALAAWQAANPETAKEDSAFFTTGYNKAMEEDGDSLPVAANLLSLLESGSFKSQDGKAVSTPFTDEQAAQLGGMVEQLAGMKPRQRKSIYRAMNARIEAAGYDQKGFWASMLSDIDRGLYRASTTLGTQAGILGDVMEAQANASQRSVDFSMDGGGGFSTPVLSVEEQQQLQRQRNYRERVGEVVFDLQNIVSEKLDPFKPSVSWLNDTIEEGLVRGPGAVLPFMAASAALGPWGAGILFTADFAEQNRRDLVGMGMDADQARQIGAAAAPAQAAVESLSNLFQLGRFPAVSAALARFTKPVGGASLVGRYVQNSLLAGITEFTEEQIQDNLIVPASQELLAALNSDMPDVDWSFYKERAIQATPELAATLLPMALVFGGVMTAADAKLSSQMTGNIDALTALNFSQAQATEIVSQKTTEERIAKAASLWRSRAGNKASLEEGAKNLSAKLRELSSDTLKHQQELERRGILPRMLHAQDDSWLLTYNDGSTASFATHGEASKARWNWAEDQLGRMHALTREALTSMERNMSAGRELAVEFKPDARTAQDVVNEGAGMDQVLRRVEQGKALGDVPVEESFDNASAFDQATQDAEGFLSSLQILGSSRNEFKDGILRTTIKLWEGSNVLTLVEEKLEGDAKAILQSSTGRAWMLGVLRNYEQESGDKLFRDVANTGITNDDLAEAWSHLGQSYLVGRSSFGEPLQQNNMRRFSKLLMRAGLAGAINAESTFWQAVVNRAQKLGELKKAGKLGEDLAAELERQLGIDSQVVHEQGAIKEAHQVAQDVAQQVDTSGYSEANPGPNGETFSFAGVNAQMPQFMRDSLDTAKTMAAAGKSSEEIRAVTGWFPGKYDGKMRWEIPDEDARYLPAVKGAKFGVLWNRRLDEVLDHPKLFDAYPYLRNVRVQTVSGLDVNGSIQGDVISLNAENWDMERFSTLLHEVQHWIQRREGFAVGSNPQAENERFGFLRSRLNYLESTDEYKAGLRLIDRAWNAFDEAAFSGDQGEAATAAYNAAEGAVEQIYRDNSSLREARKVTRQLQKLTYGQLQFSAKNAYNRSAGEIEARDVQARQSFTPEQRKAIAPYSSENIDREAAIIMGQAGIETFSASRAIPADASKVVQMPDGARLVGPTTFSIAEYRGEHKAPTAEKGASLDDLSNIYPDDIYSSNAARYYGHWGDSRDNAAISVIQSMRGKPNGSVKIYRAVPRYLNAVDETKIKQIKEELASKYRLQALSPHLANDQFFQKQISDLELQLPSEVDAKINDGDWVTTVRSYAEDHGNSALGGSYKIASKTVKAKDLFTNGDSIFEWGYAPNGVGTTFSIRAYHGTPHKVDKFSLSKIGTGEGSQAYGWGLYFAENEAVAAEYRQKLSSPVDKAVRGDGAVTVSRDYVVALAQYAIGEAMGKTKEESIARAMRMAPNLGLSIDETELARLVDAGTKWQREIGGNLYTVELLPDADEFLDWDKPLSEQSEKVKAALSAFSPSMTGADIYADVTRKNRAVRMERGVEIHDIAFAEKQASKFLQSRKIPGIRYLDGGSRGAGDGTRNYVIFDENLVRILEENGKPVAQEPEQEPEPGELAPDSPVEDLPLEGDDIPWTEETFSIAPRVLPEVFPAFNEQIKNEIAAQTKTIAAIHIDRMKVGEFAGVPLQGGFFYPAIVDNLNQGVVWAFNADNIARGVANRAAANGGFIKLVLMQEGNVVGNKTFGTIWFKLLDEAIAAKRISKTAALTELNRVRAKFATHPDSNLRTDHVKTWKSVDEARNAIIGMPQKKRGATYFQKSKTATKSQGVKIAYQSLLSQAMTEMGFPDAAAIVESIEEPSFKGVPTGAVVGIIKIDPLSESQKVMTATEAGVPEHLSYKYVLHGKPVARMTKFKVIDETFPETKNKLLSQQHTNFPLEAAFAETFSLRVTPENPIANEINGVSAKDIFSSAKQKFGITRSVYEAGYVLPDGSMLDFSGRSQTSDFKQGADLVFRPVGGRDWMKDQRGIDHREIEWGGMPDYSEQWGAMVDFLRLGAVRVDGNSGMISMHSRAKITAAQASALKAIVVAADGAYLDLEDDAGNRASMSLESGKWGKVQGLLNRWAAGETPEYTGTTFSLRPGDFASRVEAMFSPFQRSPEARLVMARVAKDRALRLGNELIDKANVIRTIGSIDREARVRAALAEDKAVQDYLDSLTPAARQTLEWEPSDLKDDQLIAAMLDFGKLMSKTTALQRGKVDLKMGDFDGAPWLPPSFYSKGSGIMPDQMAQAMFDAGLLPDAYTDTLWAELGKRIEASRKDKTAHREAVQAFKDAKKAASQKATQEAQAWADNAKKQAGSGKAQRDRIKAWLRVLDGILAAAPPEVRARVGGFVKMAGIATDEAALRYLEDRVAKLDKELDKWLKKEGLKSLDKLFKKAAADYTAGKKAKGKIGPDEHYLLQRAEAASEMDASTLVGELAKLDALATDDNLTAEQQAMAELERGILELVGNIREADAGRIFSAFDALSGIYQRGVMEWKAKQIARREQREAVRSELKADTGKTGTGKERRETEERMATGFGKLKSGWLSVSSFSEVLRYAFGAKSAQATALIDAERESSNTYEDEQQGIAEELEALFTDMAGTGKVLDGEKLRYDMAQRTIEAGDLKLSQFEAITALLIWRQEDGRRHMEGTFDENNKRTSSWGYDQAWINEVEKQLTPEGRKVMAFLAAKYGSEHAELNALYRERHGVNLPQHDNYAPILVKPMQAKAGEMVDPVSGAAVSGSILTPGSLRTRSRNAIAEPDFRDALQTFIAHKKQMGYWKAYYDLAVEAQAVLGNRELMNSVEAKAGKEAVSVIRKWLDVFAQGGVRDAAAGLAVTKWLGNMTNRAATVGLLGRVTTLLVQSTQLAAASVKMPVGAYLKRFGKLLAGQLDWSGAINSDFIQRRIKSAPPIVRQAMEGLGTATKPNQVKRLVRSLGNLLSGADGLFTGGTYAILLNYHREQGATLGLKGAELEEYAHTEAERATEEVAQPTRTGNRSLAELTATNPLAKVGWAYASEARQKVALFGWALESGDVARISKTAFLVFGIGGVLSQVLKNLWKEARGDDDEKMWSGDRMLWAALSPVTAGIPGLSLIMGEGNAWSNVKWAPSALADIVTLQGDLRDFNTVLAAAGLMNDTAAGIAALSNAGLDFAKLVENLFGGSSSE